MASQLDSDDFWPIHRSLLVNVRYVDAAHRDKRGKSQLSLRGRSEHLPVAAQYVHLFRRAEAPRSRPAVPTIPVLHARPPRRP